MRRVAKTVFVVILIVTSWTTVIFHRAVLIPPEVEPPTPTEVHGNWFGREKYGINQLFLWGTPFERGLASGQLTRSLMVREEEELTEQFRGFFPNPLVRWGLLTGLMRWFWGIDEYVDGSVLQEMYGVSKSSSHRYDGLLDPYTRQLAYHGLHEVGQMFVDFRRQDMGCTVFVVPSGASWVVGRNFDFEGGRIFDEEKIVKWISPASGHKVAAITWAGMVGVVTGVNDAGVYVSINAAGSTDFRRYGTPTTLVVLKALQRAGTAEEAVHIIEGETTFITDIFVVGDPKLFYRVEKSPQRTTASPISSASVVTNHLLSAGWSVDKVNRYRREKLTSETRMRRGERLLRGYTPAHPVGTVLGYLRDKRGLDGKLLPLGDRAAIDALIASHSVIYDAGARVLYVGRGPSLVGGFEGYDLTASFAGHGPAKVVARLPPDPAVPPGTYGKIKASVHFVELAEEALSRHDCVAAGSYLAAAPYREGADLAAAEGDLDECRGDRDGALDRWREALRRGPAYADEKDAIEKKLGLR